VADRGHAVLNSGTPYTTLVSTAELAARHGDPSWIIFDCRHNLADVDAGEHAYRAGHIADAQFVHMDRDLSGARTGANGRHPLPRLADIVAVFGRAGIDASKQVIAYDQNNGMWASRLWWLLRWLGHSAVAVLDGGLDRWIAEDRQLTLDVPRPMATTFVAKAPAATASAQEIVEHLDDRELTVIDARAPERYRGDVEPIDPVAGHIPGARNRPYTSNLAPDGAFKPAAQLRTEFEMLLNNSTPEMVVHQCGSGVTACHNVLAMAIAGLPGSRLYPGSWSEWIADPARPVARG
jgi:thiosulfate/3-mercaptopyruvate sulfurtransferase